MEEILIEKVKLREFLYDVKSTNYRDQHMRQEAWEEIGKELTLKAKTAKDIWEKLRRCFMNAMNRRRNRKSGDATKKIFPWKYEQQMSFLLPFLDSRKIQGNVQKKENVEVMYINEAEPPEMNFYETSEYSEQFNTIPPEEVPISENEETLAVAKRKRQNSYDNSINQMVNVMKENAYLRQDRYEERKSRDMDETELFFLSMAKMTKKLPPLEQAKIKLQLSQAVLEAQIRFVDHQGRTPPIASPTSSS